MRSDERERESRREEVELGVREILENLVGAKNSEDTKALFTSLVIAKLKEKLTEKEIEFVPYIDLNYEKQLELLNKEKEQLKFELLHSELTSEEEVAIRTRRIGEINYTISQLEDDVNSNPSKIIVSYLHPETFEKLEGWDFL